LLRTPRSMAEPIVPVLSSAVAGPLGVKHLPRLWLKIVLYSLGRLPEGYRHGSGGFDEFVTTTLGIDNAAFVAYVESERPDYLTLEAWVRAHATALTPETIATINERISSTDLPETMLADRRARLGPASAEITRAYALNELDDWLAMHEALTGA
jgi:Domain of unknown function (DUF5069)